ncbi:hypothetical protein [Cupriavidus sp. USMAHM13]|uniref:hypothetical protein n=1 Tax=Cupriavidus sp. USMAHM13 TaxID=1389192 RepID=UPI0012E9EA87|nr:hypothetical protein [Cupriavidus sp. USMAHM13]
MSTIRTVAMAASALISITGCTGTPTATYYDDIYTSGYDSGIPGNTEIAGYDSAIPGDAYTYYGYPDCRYPYDGYDYYYLHCGYPYYPGYYYGAATFLDSVFIVDFHRARHHRFHHGFPDRGTGFASSPGMNPGGRPGRVPGGGQAMRPGGGSGMGSGRGSPGMFSRNSRPMEIGSGPSMVHAGRPETFAGHGQAMVPGSSSAVVHVGGPVAFPDRGRTPSPGGGSAMSRGNVAGIGHGGGGGGGRGMARGGFGGMSNGGGH